VGDDEIEQALTGAWLELIAEGAAASTLGSQDRLPNPVVFRFGRTVVRFGVEGSLADQRADELARLMPKLRPSTAGWSPSRR
jgi:hypothetical protein